MATSSQLIHYLRDCYEADNRETGIANLLAKKYRHVTFLAGSDDLLRGIQDRAPVDRDRAVAAQKEASLYRKDKTLVFCAFPLVGRTGGGNRLPSRLCAPLLFYPAAVVEDAPAAFLSVDLAQQRVNFPVLAALAGQTEASRSMVEDLLGQFPEAPLSRDDIHGLMSLLMDVLPGIDAFPLAEYPKLVPERQVRREARSAEASLGNSLKCLPAVAMALIPNSPETRGVLFELADLAEMAARSAISPPVRMLLEESPAAAPPKRPRSTGRVPAVLSRSQQRVLHSAASVPLTLVVGPPGTGKSYTIAALALDHLSRGQSVLVASRMNQAVDVVAQKIEGMLGPSQCVIRGGRRQYLRELKKSLQQILHGMKRTLLVDAPDPRRLERQLDRLDRSIGRLERRLTTQSGREEQWGLATAAPPPAGLLARILHSLKVGHLNWRLGAAPPLWDLTEQYQRLLDERSRLVTALLQATVASRLHEMLRHHRRDLGKFLRAIKARADAKQEELFSEISLDVLLGTFPIWLVTLADVSKVLPLEAELFDLAIIDEATQCDMASCLPVLGRARRAVIVGDPNQLRHVSFLSYQRQQAIAERNELDGPQQQRFQYRQKSVLDLLSETLPTQEHVLFLDEHFRSMPQIIDFSNREFYAGSLKVMTQRPGTGELQCVELRLVPGGRKGHGVNRREARALVDEVLRRVESERSLPAAVCHSLGILSPLRDQVDHVLALLEERLSLDDLRRHNLLVGTAHSFQGEERDVMYLSLVVDPQSHPASFQFLNNPNVFNVSITRARNEQLVFCSVRPEEVKPDTLLRRYLDHIAHGPAPASQPGAGRHHDAFLSEVRDALQVQGFHAWPAYPAAGLKIDLVVERGGQTLGIDLIGYPGEFAAPLDLERYRTFQRAGLVLFPLPYRAWRGDRSRCLAAIQRWHEQQSRGPQRHPDARFSILP